VLPLPGQPELETVPGRPIPAIASELAAAAGRTSAAALLHPVHPEPPKVNQVVPVNPRPFFKEAPQFCGNQAAVRCSSNVFTKQSFFFRFSPCSFVK